VSFTSPIGPILAGRCQDRIEFPHEWWQIVLDGVIYDFKFDDVITMNEFVPHVSGKPPRDVGVCLPNAIWNARCSLADNLNQLNQGKL
jgi:hypothetical protein